MSITCWKGISGVQSAVISSSTMLRLRGVVDSHDFCVGKLQYTYYVTV